MAQLEAIAGIDWPDHDFADVMDAGMDRLAEFFGDGHQFIHVGKNGDLLDSQRLILEVEITDLIENDIGNEALGSNG